ncbi:PIN domain-containing protein [Fusobacterium animalis]|uniref:PIN domain-containing protein n=1 Tax=Fusobacterium animalis TaxID=76859 RepID=UPI0030CC5983
MLNHPISIFLDTNIFISQKYDFSDTKNSDFNNLIKMVNDGKIKLYISQIVEHEVKKHIKEDIFEIFKEVKKSRNIILKKFSKNYSQTSVLSNLFSFYNLKKDDISEEIISKFDKFLKDSKASKLDCKDIDSQQIIVDYMDSNPPFENKEKKKYEFPDAFMIAKLKKFVAKKVLFMLLLKIKVLKKLLKVSLD